MSFDTTDKKLMEHIVSQVFFEPNTLNIVKFFELDKENIKTQEEVSKIVATHMASRHLHWNGSKLDENAVVNFKTYCEKIAEFSLYLNESCLGVMLEEFTQEIQNPNGIIDNEDNVFLKQKTDQTYALSTHFIDIMYKSLHAIFDYSLLSDAEKQKRKAIVDNFLNHYEATLDLSNRPDNLFRSQEKSIAAVEALLPSILKKAPNDLNLDNEFLQKLYEQLNTVQDFSVVVKEINLQTKEIATQEQVSEIVANHIAFKLLSYPHRLHFDLAIKQLTDFSSGLDKACIASMSVAFKNALEASKNMFSELVLSKLDEHKFPLYSEYSTRMIELMTDNLKQNGFNQQEVFLCKDLVINALTESDTLEKTALIKRPNVSEFRNQQFPKNINTDMPKIK